MPELQIIDRALWERAHAAIEKRGARYAKRTARGTLLGRTPGTRESTPYLLSGLLQCHGCGESLIGNRGAYYRCHHYMTRGAAVCGHATWYPRAAIDALVLGHVERVLLGADAIETVIAEAMTLWQAQQAPAAAQRAALTTELHRLDREIAKLEHDLVDGAPWRLIDASMTARQDRRAALRGELDQIAARERGAATLTGPALRAALSASLADLQGLASRKPEEARRALMDLLDGERIVVRPRRTGCALTGSPATRCYFGPKLDPSRPPAARFSWWSRVIECAC